MSHGPESAFTHWLKKYRYINIALIYLGTALVVIHFAEAVVHGLHMPDITFSLIVVLALAGLPIVLLIAWAMGHRREKTTEESSAAKPIKRNWSKIITASVLSLLLFVAAIFAYNKFFYQSKFTGKERSIAVIPFENMSSDKENEYFSDGMTTEITTQLSKIAELKVIAPNSAMTFKDSKKTIKEIAEELGVTSLCKGSVQKAGNDIRITAQLIDANTQEQIWADNYDRDFKEVFAIQSEVAQKIAYQLNATLTKEEKKKIEKKPTENLQAYEFFLQATQLRDKFHETLDTGFYLSSQSLFQKAILLDANYALAHAGLGHLYNKYTELVKNDSVLKNLQIEEINKAWSMAPEDDYVNAVKGTILRTSFRNMEESYQSLKKAFEINPNNTNTLLELGILLSDLGLFDERIILLKKAIKLDPLNSLCYGYLGGAEVHLNNLKEGIQYIQTALKLEPNMFYVIDRMAYIYALQDSLKQTDYWLQKFFQTIPPDRKSNFYKGFGQYSAYCYAKLGNKTKALEISAHWRVLLVLGMKEEALHRMGSGKNDYLVFKTHLPHNDFDIIRADPRFLELLEKKRIRYEENKKRFSIAGILN